MTSEAYGLPKLFNSIDERFFAPEWWSMDGEPMAVFMVDIEKSIRANKVIVEESPCMTRWLGGLIEKHGRVVKDHAWVPA